MPAASASSSSSSSLAALADRVLALLPQEGLVHRGNVVPILATLVVGLLTLVLVARVVEDHMSKGGAETFYPTKNHTRVLSYKLLTGGLGKGKKWQKDVQKDGFQLCDRVLSARLPLVPEAKHVADMIRVCELPNHPVSRMPLIYPAVLMVYPNCLLFTKPEYPFPAVGSVHVANHTKIFRAMPVDEEYPAMIKVDPVVRPAKKGSEVTFISTLHDKAGEPVWTNTSTFLVLHKRLQTITPTVKPERELEPPSTTAPTLEKEFKLAADMGRRYAAVANDNNPIHTSALAAKAFGFPGVIMHGMYFIVRAAAECQAMVGDRLQYPVEVTAKFVRPVVLPHKVAFKVTPTTATTTGEEASGGKKGKGSNQTTTTQHQLRYELLNKAGKIAVEGNFICRVEPKQ